MFLIPVAQGQDAWFNLFYKQPDNFGTGTVQLYYRCYTVQAIGHDTYGRPVFSSANIFRGETDITLPLAGDPDWHSNGISVRYNSPQAPAWGTHLAILFDTESIPAMSFYIADMVANVL